MKSKNFVKNTFRDKYDRLRKQELARFIDQSSGKLDSRYSVKVRCFLCASDNYHAIFEKQGFTFVKCKNCGLIFVNPQIKESHINSEYVKQKSIDVWSDVLLSPKQYEYDRKKYEHFLDIIMKHSKRGRKLLDVGCSVGHFLYRAKQQGWDVEGLELNKKAVRIAREKFGIVIKEKMLEDSGFPDKYFDLISFQFILEHVSDPKSLIKAGIKKLAAGGLVLITVPNSDSLACRIMHDKTFTFDGRNHLNYFSPSTLSKLLKTCGVKVLHQETSVSCAEPIYNYLNYEDPYLSDFAQNNLSKKMRASIEDFIAKNNLGYYIFVLGRVE